MATEKWIAGAVPSFSTAFTTSSLLNSISSNNAIMSDLIVGNASNLDLFCDVSLIMGSVTTVGSPFIGISLCPLLHDATTFGDGRTSFSGPPPSTYFEGVIVVALGTIAPSGGITGIRMPPTNFKFAVHNGLGTPFASSGNAMQYKTYNRSIA
jgi:hypothetical protein